MVGNGKLRDCDCSLHRNWVGDAKCGATNKHGPLSESYRGTNLAQVEELNLKKKKRLNSNIPLVTDNTKNRITVVIKAGLRPQIPCFAHLIILTCQRWISEKQPPQEEQQAAICSQITGKTQANFLKPINSYQQLLSIETAPSVSRILLLKAKILQLVAPSVGRCH